MALSSGPLWEFVYWSLHMCTQVWKLSRIALMETKQGRWTLFCKWNKIVGCVCLSGLRNYSPLGEAHSTRIYSHSIGVIRWAVRIAVGSMSLSRAIYIVLNYKHVHSLASAPIPVTYSMDFSPKHALISKLFRVIDRDFAIKQDKNWLTVTYFITLTLKPMNRCNQVWSGWMACTNVLRVMSFITRHRYCWSGKNRLWDIQILYTKVLVTYGGNSVEHTMFFTSW